MKNSTTTLITITEARKKVKELHKIIKSNGYKSVEGRAAMIEETKLYEQFEQQHGRSALIEMQIGKSSSFARSSNAKGNGYGNM